MEADQADISPSRLSLVDIKNFEFLLRSSAFLLRRIAWIGRHARQLDWLAERAWRLVGLLEVNHPRPANSVDQATWFLHTLDSGSLALRLRDILERSQNGRAARPELIELAIFLEESAAAVNGVEPRWPAHA